MSGTVGKKVAFSGSASNIAIGYAVAGPLTDPVLGHDAVTAAHHDLFPAPADKQLFAGIGVRPRVRVQRAATCEIVPKWDVRFTSSAEPVGWHRVAPPLELDEALPVDFPRHVVDDLVRRGRAELGKSLLPPQHDGLFSAGGVDAHVGRRIELCVFRSGRPLSPYCYHLGSSPLSCSPVAVESRFHAATQPRHLSQLWLWPTATAPRARALRRGACQVTGMSGVRAQGFALP